MPHRSVRNNTIGELGGSAIGVALKHNCALTELKCVPENSSLFSLPSLPPYVLNFSCLHSLDGNRLGVASATAIGKMLRHNKTLTQLK